MKPTHLNTLSARIEELHELLVFKKIDLEGFFHLTLNANKKSKTAVTLSQFVPCDENGVPLEKPPKVIHTKAQVTLRYQYIRSEDSVIFEGWESVATNKIHHHNVFNSELGLEIEFYKEKESLIRIWHRTRDTELTIIQTLADLAASTTKNPLKLK